MSNYKEFRPNWYEEAPPQGSYRSILKWGDPLEFKHPNERLYKTMKEIFHMTDEDFKEKEKMGLDKVEFIAPPQLKNEEIEFFINLLGKDNVKSDEFARLSVAYGKTMIDLMRLREKIAENLPDLVLYPRNKEDIINIVKYCDMNEIPVYVYGGGSTVTRGVECTKGGVSLDMRPHMNKVIRINDINQTVTVEPGIPGPAFEAELNKKGYTCGHFPQSFEYSSVGGWVVTRGAGQNSTYFGKIEDMVICQEYVTPIGIIKTGEYPANATGPSIDQIMMGSEGTFGILTEVTLKIFKNMIENHRKFSFMFKTWEDGKNAAREIMQGQFGLPSVFRLSDSEETDVAMKLYGIEGTPIDSIIKRKGFKKGERCLMLGFTDGEKEFTKVVYKNINKICRNHGGMFTTRFVTEGWEKGRFRDPYLREDLQDFGIMTDTLECCVNWEQLQKVYEGVRSYCKARPDTICMTHMSHFYPQGCNLYFIFIAKIDEIDEYLKYQSGILDNIQKYGASMSHHHGIGKMTAPWLEGQIGKNSMDIIRALKNHFDPNNIMNPGGTLGLDIKEEEKRNLKK